MQIAVHELHCTSPRVVWFVRGEPLKSVRFLPSVYWWRLRIDQSLLRDDGWAFFVSSSLHAYGELLFEGQSHTFEQEKRDRRSIRFLLPLVLHSIGTYDIIATIPLVFVVCSKIVAFRFVRAVHCFVAELLTAKASINSSQRFASNGRISSNTGKSFRHLHSIENLHKSGWSAVRLDRFLPLATWTVDGYRWTIKGLTESNSCWRGTR